jgi:hypothetical protein
VIDFLALAGLLAVVLVSTLIAAPSRRGAVLLAGSAGLLCGLLLAMSEARELLRPWVWASALAALLLLFSMAGRPRREPVHVPLDGLR